MEPLDGVVRDLQYQLLLNNCVSKSRGITERRARACTYLETIRIINSHFKTDYIGAEINELAFKTQDELIEFIKKLPLRTSDCINFHQLAHPAYLVP